MNLCLSGDEKAFNILNIPPARKPKEEEVIIEEIFNEEEQEGEDAEECLLLGILGWIHTSSIHVVNMKR